MADLATELLFASRGLGAWVSPGRVRYTQAHRREAIRLLTQIQDAWRDFLTGPARGDSDLPGVDWDEMRQFVEGTPDFETAEAKTDGLSETEIADHVEVAERCRAYLRSIAPLRDVQTPLGPEPADPSISEMLAFRRAYWVADRPERLLDEILAGTVTRDQAVTVEQCYPEIFAAMRMAGGDQLVAIRAARPDYQLGRRRVRVMEIFLRQPSDSPSSIPEQLQEVKRRDEPPPDSPQKLNLPGLETLAQKLEQR